jgi:hypothetical protein
VAVLGLLLLDFGPIGPIILLTVLAIIAVAIFVAGAIVGAIVALFFSSRRKKAFPAVTDGQTR